MSNEKRDLPTPTGLVPCRDQKCANTEYPCNLSDGWCRECARKRRDAAKGPISRLMPIDVPPQLGAEVNELLMRFLGDLCHDPNRDMRLGGAAIRLIASFAALEREGTLEAFRRELFRTPVRRPDGSWGEEVVEPKPGAKAKATGRRRRAGRAR